MLICIYISTFTIDDNGSQITNCALFTGYTIIQIPEFCRIIITKIKSLWKRSARNVRKEEDINTITELSPKKTELNMETNILRQNKIRMDDYLHSRLRLINEYQQHSVHSSPSSLKVFLELEKNTILQLIAES